MVIKNAITVKTANSQYTYDPFKVAGKILKYTFKAWNNKDIFNGWMDLSVTKVLVTDKQKGCFFNLCNCKAQIILWQKVKYIEKGK